ncbi:MAG TPA: M48 family peptidase [Eggerthellaceae bacterium]|nr:M48 family peptidase [Eggerthellaceae bacterium]
MPKVYSSHLVFVDDLEVWVVEKGIRRMNMRVTGADAHVEVSVPRGTPLRDVERFVRSRRAWIEEGVRRTLSSPMAQAEAASPAEVSAWREVVQACVPALVAAWEPILGVKAGTLAYRNMKSRWGSCQPQTGRICINVRLALYPPECLEYVVVHELCHLLVPGHGSDFHELMTRVMPDWRQRRAKLR